jgi:hypothetical protein
MQPDSIAETKKNHLWRKVVWCTDPEMAPLGPHHSVEVYCCEESNGYAVWYVRKLARDDELGSDDVENGDYLLNFYSKLNRDEAIERAVLIANSESSVDKLILALDALAERAQKV